MNAAQGLDFRRPLKSSPIIEDMIGKYRSVVPTVEDDVVMKDYIESTMKFLESYEIKF